MYNILIYFCLIFVKVFEVLDMENIAINCLIMHCIHLQSKIELPKNIYIICSASLSPQLRIPNWFLFRFRLWSTDNVHIAVQLLKID